MFKGFRNFVHFSRQISTNKYGKWTDTKRESGLANDTWNPHQTRTGIGNITIGADW